LLFSYHNIWTLFVWVFSFCFRFCWASQHCDLNVAAIVDPVTELSMLIHVLTIDLHTPQPAADEWRCQNGDLKFSSWSIQKLLLLLKVSEHARVPLLVLLLFSLFTPQFCFCFSFLVSPFLCLYFLFACWYFVRSEISVILLSIHASTRLRV
jgi:hypothetical protein